MSLARYRQKRNFSSTAEPEGKRSDSKQFRFVVQRHQASHLHYDFRLELGGVLKSWAVPKGPSVEPGEKRLAVQVEDHPVDYINFHGRIPKGNYGAGTVAIWDKGTFTPQNKTSSLSERQALAGIKKGHLDVELHGKKLRGLFSLVRLKNTEPNWLLIKQKSSVSANGTEAVKTQRKASTAPPVKATKQKTSLRPMLASVAKQAFDDSDWIYEMKWDGYRIIAELNNEQTNLWSRNGLNYNERFSLIADACNKIKKNVVLDGEVVLMNDKQVPDFQQLQHYEPGDPGVLLYYVFDLLYVDGKSVKDLSLLERKKKLKSILGKRQLVRYCDHITTKGIEFFTAVHDMGLEGIIAKEKDSTYREGVRSKSWLKIKGAKSEEVLIAGFTQPRNSRKYFGALILATPKGKKFVYRGHVGTGFSQSLQKELLTKLKKLQTDKSPFSEKVPLNEKVTWIKPSITVEIGYGEITQGGLFRHPVFLRVRDDKDLNKKTS
jgi:bifunctional non-homologous end joining protein LigD